MWNLLKCDKIDRNRSEKDELDKLKKLVKKLRYLELWLFIVFTVFYSPGTLRKILESTICYCASTIKSELHWLLNHFQWFCEFFGQNRNWISWLWHAAVWWLCRNEALLGFLRLRLKGFLYKNCPQPLLLMICDFRN